MRYVNVDIETTGTIPGRHAVIEVAWADEKSSESVLVLPHAGAEIDREAMLVNRIDLETLEWYDEHLAGDWGCGVPLYAALIRLKEFAGPDEPTFVGWNAAFDWSFLSWAFGRCRVYNPFHYFPLDIKALACGKLGMEWEKCKIGAVRQALGLPPRTTERHSALADCVAQQEVFKKLTEMK